MNAETLDKLMDAQEELEPELRAFVEPHDTLGKVLRSPLVYSVPYNECMNALLNAQFRTKLKALDEARVEKMWEQIVFLHERPFRLSALQSVQYEVDDDARFWRLVRETWDDTEFPHARLDQWIEMWSIGRPARECAMDEDERAKLATLPDILRVWRGGRAAGLSWTLDRDKAVWFARRFKDRDNKLLSGVLRRGAVLAYLDGRGESEVVAVPNSVRVVRVEEVYSGFE